MSRQSLQDLYRSLRGGKSVSPDDVLWHSGSDGLLDVQAASLAALLRRDGVAWCGALQILQNRFPVVADCLNIAECAKDSSLPLCSSSRIIRLLRSGGEIAIADWQEFISDALSARIHPAIVSFVLMEIALAGMSPESTSAMASAMLSSGNIHDYRAEVQPRKLLRRYPTGAVSEKTALILPSLIRAASLQLPLASNFLVAKSLSFTGGTWDKLSCIPGFALPSPGRSSLEILRRSNVVMCATNEDVCPADRMFYQLRSICGTVTSEPLIIASIASKQGALPADFLLLDVRYGPGAFLLSRKQATCVAVAIGKILESWGVRCGMLYTASNEPNGSTIGNSVEVCEAVDVMRPNPSGQYSLRLVENQWQLVKTFFVELCNEAGTAFSPIQFSGIADELRASGSLLNNFKELLSDHSVDPQLADMLVADPEGLLLRETERYTITSPSTGVIASIDQLALGEASNFLIGSGATEFGGNRGAGGVVLLKSLGERLISGEPMISFFIGREVSLETVEDVRQRLLAAIAIE